MKYLLLVCCSLAAGLLAPRAAAASFASEYELLRHLPTATLSGIITNSGQTDTNGFIGFHLRDGNWYEAGMQRGGCWMLIGAVLAGDKKRADAAWTSIEATFARQMEDGGFVSNRKPGDRHEPTYDERVETAYFYLQELGHALLFVQASPMEPYFRKRIAEVEPKLRRACAFIQAGYDGIVKKCGHTANRLFISAKAFGLCGTLLKDEELKASSKKLVAAAMQRRDADGVFIENGGRDSSYNAVSLLMAQVLSFYIADPELDSALARTMAWERSRIRPTGEVQVEGNTRTGLGQEHMMGHPKNVNYHEVALALCYFGMLHNDTPSLELAEKVHTWHPKP